MELVKGALIIAAFASGLIPQTARAQPRLVFDHKIGTDWEGNGEWMSFVAISPDGRTIASDGDNQGGPFARLGLWSFPGGEHLRSAGDQPLAISPDFRYLATETGIVDLQARVPPTKVPRQTRLYANAGFSPSGEFVAFVPVRSGKERRRIIVFRTADRSVVARFGTRYAASLAFHPNKQILASGHWNNVTLWDLRSGDRLALLTYIPRPTRADGYYRDGRYICGLGFSRDGSSLAAGSDDGELQIWDLVSSKLLHSIAIGYGYVSNPAFSPDGKLVAAGTYADGTVTLVDVSSGAILSQIKVSMFGCGSVAFSPDGRYLVTPSNGGQIVPGKFDRGGSIRVFRVENH